MPELDYFIVDVFTETILAGNPLAVVFDTCGLSAARMQQIAREFNLSETTFVQRRAAAVERGEGVRVRIFTTQEELDFAGHPTLGTASVLRLQAPECVHADTVTLALNAGSIPVRFAGAGSFSRMTQRDPEFGPELDPVQVARFTGLTVDDLDPALPPQIVSTGTSFAIVALRSAESLARLKIDQDRASAWLRPQGTRWFYVIGPTQSDHPAVEPAWRARMQFYGGEDPATGSAAGCAISYLVARGVVPPGAQVNLQQGIEVGRPSQISVSAQLVAARVTDVGVAGSTVPVAKGQIFLT